jgi:Xaa-Pro aminopeptidase
MRRTHSTIAARAEIKHRASKFPAAFAPEGVMPVAGKLALVDRNDPYFVDCPQRVRDLQAAMHAAGIDAYLGSRPRTLSWLLDAFIPWRSYVLVPAEGMPTLFTFLVDGARIASETWLDVDHVVSYAGLPGMEPIANVAKAMKQGLRGGRGRVAYEDGISVYTPEGYLTRYEHQVLQAELSEVELLDGHGIVDRLSLVKDAGTINRFREAGRICDAGHTALREAVTNGGWRGRTETEIAGIAALAMRRAGSVSEWNFAGLNEIATGWRTALGACTPPTDKPLAAGEPCMFDLHSMFKLGLGDHSHNYLLAPATKRQRWHADNFVALVGHLLKTYRPGMTPEGMLYEVTRIAADRGCVDFVMPAVEHGIGLWGDEWKVGAELDQAIPYWTDRTHAYGENELVIAALQYVCPQDEIGFRYENPVLLGAGGCETMSKFPLAIEEIA